ncbi:MAG: thioredoxin domain-containing protein [Candidatus Methylomirabilia bacterium]
MGGWRFGTKSMMSLTRSLKARPDFLESVRSTVVVSALSVIFGAMSHPAASAGVLTNRLATAASPYLREAADHPIAWQAWGEKAFRLARELDRPILMDIGGIWCHWCHVMDRETYSDHEVAAVINRFFIPIRVDRDARPDIDRRYQEAIHALTGHSGWPLTVFMTPAGKVFFGGGLFYPDDRPGRPGFKTLLPKLYEIYRSKREMVKQASADFHAAVAALRAKALRAGDLSPALVDAIAQTVLDRFGPATGGLGQGPQPPRGSVVELALKLAVERGDERMLQVATRTLEAMARGGIRDQLGGGFHRYSTDPGWRMPHFEQMAYVQAQVLINYLHAYQVTGNGLFREVAEGVLAYVDRVLADRQQGGFYAHQDADMTREDDGDYFSWSLEEVRQALPNDEAEVLSRRFDIRPVGEMRENTAKNVLWIARSLDEIAAELEKPVPEITSLLRSGTARLLAARGRRKAPLVDRTILADRNGMLISAYLEVFKVLGRRDARAFALRSLDALWGKLYHPHSGVAHAYYPGRPLVGGFLADQVWFAWALLDAFEVAGEARYLGRAREVADFLLGNFWDPASGGFFDTRQSPSALAILRERTKPIEDTETPSPNALAARLLDRLFYLTNDSRYRQRAEATLKMMAGSELGLRGAGYALAVDQLLNPPAHAVIVGPRTDLRTRALWEAALGTYRSGKIVAAYDPGQVRLEELPPAVVAAIKNTAPRGGPRAYVCVGTMCSLPTDDPGKVAELVKDFGRAERPPAPGRLEGAGSQ